MHMQVQMHIHFAGILHVHLHAVSGGVRTGGFPGVIPANVK